MNTGLPSDSRLAAIAGSAADRVRHELLVHRRSGETLTDPRDLKSGHAVDAMAAEIVRGVLADWSCNVFIEGEPCDENPSAPFCVYVDPIDGSLNWDRGVGDPAFALAAAPGARAECPNDLVFAWVEGLRSGDRYRIGQGQAIYSCRLRGTEIRMQTAAPERVECATGYLRAGYGRARRQLARTLPLYLCSRDLRAVDNAAIEFCEVGRNAAHFMVEARGISDGFNVIAWPLARAAGAVLRGLDGTDLGRVPWRVWAAQDYVLAGNEPLAADILGRMWDFEQAGRAEFEHLTGRIR